MRLSIVVPAYNEERCLPETLERVSRAVAILAVPCEVIVVNNDSQDGTERIAAAAGAAVVFEKEHNIGKVRNSGARVSTGDGLVFIDADTLIPDSLLQAIVATLDDARCLGGAVGVRYDTVDRRFMRWYLRGWAFWGSVFAMAQGAAQFCRRSTFDEIGGYDETIYVGEDVEFYWRLRRRARVTGGTVRFLSEPSVVTSGRRFDKMGFWKTLLLTHPVFIRLAWRRKWWWRDWYDQAVR